MADDYEYWRKALEGTFGEVHDSDPRSGFYRARRSKGGQFEPVAIWRNDNGQTLAVISGKPIRADDIWTWACKHPVAEDVYRAVAKGGQWPDMDEAVAESMKPITRHHNEPPDEMRILDDQIDSALVGVDAYTEITSQDQLNAAQSLRSRLLELGNQADTQRETAKRPHLTAARVVDKLWMPMVNKAKDGADSVKRAMTAFLNKLAADTAATEGEAGSATPPPLPQVKGAYGRAANTEMVKKVSGILNIDELFSWPPMHDHPEVHDCLLRLSQKAVNKGLTPPGVRIVEEVKIR